MRFRYIAAKKDGNIVESEIEANSLSAVLNYLSARGLKPISVKRLTTTKSKISAAFSGKKISTEDQIFIFRYLALMLRIGTDLLQAINILIEDFDSPAVKSFLLEVKSNLEQGLPLYTTFEKYPKVFSPVYVNLIKAGEKSGNLESVFENITDALQKEKFVKDQIRNAMIYPIILLGIASFILIFLVTFALPKIARVFNDSGFNPPTFSKIVFTVGLFIGKIWIWLFLGAIAFVIFIVYLYKNSLWFRRLFWSTFDSLPLIRNVVQKRALQRFAAVASSLIKAGLPINQALEITADASGQPEIKQALIRISREGLAKGLSLGEAFKREKMFPRVVVNLIAIAERAGHVEEVLSTLSDFYIQEVDNSLKRTMSFVEPLMLLAIGVVIGAIALAVIVPIYQLTTQF